MTATAALLLAAALGQLSELAPLRDPSADGTTQATGANAHRDLAPARESPLGDLVFRAPLVPGGTDALPLAITLNGISATPVCAYRAKDATDDSWPAWGGYGETLTKVEAGANTSSQDAPHLGANEKLRQFAAGDYYQSTSTDACSLGTDDIVVEFGIRRQPSGTEGVIATTASTTPSTTGLVVSSNLASAEGVYTRLCIASSCVVMSEPAAPSSLLVVLAGIDRNYASATYGARMYVNGVAKSTVDASGLAASVNSGKRFTLGAYDSAAFKSPGALEYIIIWKQANWLPGSASNGTMLDALAADRSARFWGTREEVNGLAPTVETNAARCVWTAAGKLDCYSASAPVLGGIFPPGAGGIENTNIGGGLFVVARRLQSLLQSRALNTTWTQTGTAPTATSSTTPFLDARTTYKVVDDDAGAEEYISQTIDITALATGGTLAVCPWTATESGTQLYTVSVTEQTGGSCTTTTTHYKPTATTSWQQHSVLHTVLDGDCTQAVITLRPYDVASGVGATGSVAALVNAYGGASTTVCPQQYVETTTATATASTGGIRYSIAYSSALGQRQINDSGDVVVGTRSYLMQVSGASASSFSAGGVATAIYAGDDYCGVLTLPTRFECWQGASWLFAAGLSSRAPSAVYPWTQHALRVDYDRDLYWGATPVDQADATTTLSAAANSSFDIGDGYANPVNNNAHGAMTIRNVEVYR